MKKHDCFNVSFLCTAEKRDRRAAVKDNERREEL